jgi:hypothetical protein
MPRRRVRSSGALEMQSCMGRTTVLFGYMSDFAALAYYNDHRGRIKSALEPKNGSLTVVRTEYFL